MGPKHLSAWLETLRCAQSDISGGYFHEGLAIGDVMLLFYFSIGLTVISNALYHVVQKSTPGMVNPALSLAVTYAMAAVACLALLPFFPLQ